MKVKYIVFFVFYLCFAEQSFANECDIDSGNIESLLETYPELGSLVSKNRSGLHKLSLYDMKPDFNVDNIETGGLALRMLDKGINISSIERLKKSNKYGDDITFLDELFRETILSPSYIVFMNEDGESQYFLISNNEDLRTIYIGALIGFYNMSEYVDEIKNKGLRCVEAHYINAETNELIVLDTNGHFMFSRDSLALFYKYEFDKNNTVSVMKRFSQIKSSDKK